MRGKKYNLEIIEVKLDNYSEFAFEDYDKYFIYNHKVLFNFAGDSSRRSKEGIVFSIKEDGVCEILTTNSVASAIRDRNMTVMLCRSRESGILYTYAKCNVILHIDINRLEVEYYMSIDNKGDDNI